MRNGRLEANQEGEHLSLRVEEGSMRFWDPDGRETRLAPGDELPGSEFGVATVSLATSPR